MTTTEPTTLPGEALGPPPAWLDLDAMVAPEIQALIRELTVKFQNCAYELEDSIDGARVALNHVDRAVKDTSASVQAIIPVDHSDIQSGLTAMISHFSGSNALWTAMARLSALVDPDQLDDPEVED